MAFGRKVRAFLFFFFSSRRRHTRSLRDWSSDVCSSDLSSGPRRPWTRWPRDPSAAGAASGFVGEPAQLDEVAVTAEADAHGGAVLERAEAAERAVGAFVAHAIAGERLRLGEVAEGVAEGVDHCAGDRAGRRGLPGPHHQQHEPRVAGVRAVRPEAVTVERAAPAEQVEQPLLAAEQRGVAERDAGQPADLVGEAQRADGPAATRGP